MNLTDTINTPDRTHQPSSPLFTNLSTNRWHTCLVKIAQISHLRFVLRSLRRIDFIRRLYTPGVSLEASGNTNLDMID